MDEHEAADWLEIRLSPPERLMQREAVIWLGQQARKIGRDGWCANVGTWCGYSALALALGGPTVLAIDTFLAGDAQTGRQALERVEGGLQSTFRRFLDHVNAAPIPVRVVPLVGNSTDVAGAVGIEMLDMVFIDGDHSLPGVTKDLAVWSFALRPGGLLCGHDVQQPAIGQAIEHFVKTCGWPPIEHGPDQIWFTRKPQPS